MITVIGEALVDIIVDPQGDVTSVVGGAPLNTARTVARLGVPSTFLGGVSTDAFGERIMRLLDADAVSLGLERQVDEPTTIAIASLDTSGAATYRFMMDGTSAAALTPDMALAHVGNDCRALHVGTLGLVLQPLADASVAGGVGGHRRPARHGGSELPAQRDGGFSRLPNGARVRAGTSRHRQGQRRRPGLPCSRASTRSPPQRDCTPRPARSCCSPTERNRFASSEPEMSWFSMFRAFLLVDTVRRR